MVNETPTQANPPTNPVQPTAPNPLTSPFPANEVMLPFDPPVTYRDGAFNAGKTLLQLLESGVPTTEMSGASIASNVFQHPPDNVTVTVYSKTYVPIGEINDYISLTFQLARNRTASGEIILKGNDPMAPYVLNCTAVTVPITIETGTIRWSGRVFSAEDRLGPLPGEDRPMNTVVVQLVSDYAWLERILCWPAPELPIEIQFPAEAVYVGPAVTVVATLIAEQAYRLQSGIWDFINGDLIGASEEWLKWATLALEGKPPNLLDALFTPVCVIPVDTIFDTSPWVSITGRMDQVSTLIAQVARDTGTNVSVGLWLPDRDPQPEGLLYPLSAPTILVYVTNNLGVTGPSGTFLDGIVQDVVDLQRSVLGEVLAPFLNPENEYAPQGINIAPVLGVNFEQPWVILRGGPNSPLIESSLTGRAPLAYRIVGGGKSPQWMDDLLNLLAGYAVQAITVLIGITGIPSDLFDGIIDDVVFAFQEIVNTDRQNSLGPYAFPEYFVQTGASAYTLDEWFALKGAMWDTRGLYTYQWTFLNGFPYTLGVDLFVGQLASFANRDKLYTDWVDSIVFTDDRTTRLGKVAVAVGDNRFVENPIAKIYRKLVAFEKAMQVVTLSYN